MWMREKNSPLGVMVNGVAPTSAPQSSALCILPVGTQNHTVDLWCILGLREWCPSLKVSSSSWCLNYVFYGSILPTVSRWCGRRWIDPIILCQLPHLLGHKIEPLVWWNAEEDPLSVAQTLYKPLCKTCESFDIYLAIAYKGAISSTPTTSDVILIASQQTSDRN